MDKLVKKLEEYRLEHRITQQELADMLGVTFAAVSRWLNGHAKPSRIHAYHIRKLISGEGWKR
ncbi:MAG: helix-turn-helix transcriptional regulator [Candidatus Zixiibacteriota bacterium]